MTPVEKALLLHGTDVFRETSSEVLAEVGAVADEMRVEGGMVIFSENEPADAFYAVVSGRVQLSQGGREIKTVGPGEVFGVWAAFDGEPRVVTATAIEDVSALKIAYEDFHDLLLDNMEIGRGIFKVLARQIRDSIIAVHEEVISSHNK
ncbi:MAG: Crp/Fnr family transcriptional regulator [Candidatus Latescibacteria bacterium]|nr:Crp/Fnr family transcriptional regulator [Candidatus Latescibacterota bacterium]